MHRLPFDPPLYLISDRVQFSAPAGPDGFAADEWRALEAAIAAGVGAVQLREKDLDGGPLYRRAVRLLECCSARGTKLLINDRCDVALATGADGVHLPGEGMPVAQARALVGARLLIGRSLHSAEELVATSGADFIVFGPVYETASKRGFGPPQGVRRLAEIVRLSSMPVCAIGGITRERVAEVRAAGAAGIAVIGEIFGASDPAAATERLIEALTA